MLFIFKALVPINIWENILVALDTFNFDIICILGQVPRSDMSSYWIIILHTRILEALFFLVKPSLEGCFLQSVHSTNTGGAQVRWRPWGQK